MGNVKDLNIKNQTYYYFDDMIDTRKFESNLLKIDQKLHRDFDIYYIGYIMIKTFSTYENICSVNPLCLIFHSATGYFKEEYGEKYLILDLIEKYEGFLEFYQKLKQLTEKNFFMKKIMQELVLIQMMM